MDTPLTNNDGFIPVPKNYKVKLGDTFRNVFGGTERKIIQIKDGRCFASDSSKAGFCKVDFGENSGWYYKPALKQIYLFLED